MTNSMGAFNDLKVGTKISAGFAMILALLLAIAGTSYWSVGNLTAGFETYAQRVSVGEIAKGLSADFTNYRRFVREYALTGDETVLEKAETVKATLAKDIERAVNEIKNPERNRLAHEIAADTASYSASVDVLKLRRREQKTQLEEVLDPAGLSMRKDVGALAENGTNVGNQTTVAYANRMTEHVMLARLSANKALARKDAEAEKVTYDELDKLDKLLSDLESVLFSAEGKTLHERIAASARRYREAFGKAIADMNEVDRLVNGEMRETATRIAEKSMQISESAAAEMDRVEQEVKALAGFVQQLGLALALGGALLGSVLAFVIGRGIARPIQAIAEVLLELAKGNKNVEVPYADRKDEVGENARAAKIFKENLVRMEEMESEKKDAERRAAEQRRADMHRLADEFQRAVGGIVDTVASASSQLESAANALTKTADTTQQLSGMVASASEQTSANVQGVAAASEELASTVSEISRQVQQSSNIAGQAVSQAAKTNERVQELSQSAERIGNVIGLINSIAGQTNLLALNATIEAARAGDAGKGFAVVAQEVKALASQTGKATDEIASQIASMQSATLEAVGAIREITETINKISEISGAIAAAVEEQGTTTQEISRNVTEAAKGTSEVATSITDVSRGANETGSASSQVLASAKQLSSESGNLRREVDRFLSTVRAA